ncbi:hypothetical protein [Streptosporangium saharense]|uniref:hypothetical protein n=1 Tax=Streptosporangium saharense TaxID=1706840 RepID=UPI003413CEE7
MSDPTVVTGLSLLGVPPLPDVNLLDEHIATLDEAASRHRRLVVAGTRNYRLADGNRGPAAEALHERMTGSDGPLLQAGDLAHRLTTAADGLRVSRKTIEWISGLLAGVAVAAVTAVAVAPELMPRLTAMAKRFTEMLRSVMESIGRIFRKLFTPHRAKRIETLAGKLHNDWRANRKLADGSFDPRVKTTASKTWTRKHGTDQVDIANTHYKDLPADWQMENRRSATSAIKIVDDAKKLGMDPKSEEFMEHASEKVHIAWLKRNGQWASDEQKLPYHRLSEAEKEKDRVVVRLALED